MDSTLLRADAPLQRPESTGAMQRIRTEPIDFFQNNSQAQDEVDVDGAVYKRSGSNAMSAQYPLQQDKAQLFRSLK